MENSPRAQERGGCPSPNPNLNPNPYPFPNQSLLPSPTSTTSSSSSSNNTTNGAAFRHPNYHHHHHSLSSPKQNHHHQPQQQNPPVTRSESNPYPTTFVQADTTSFKQVVQMLTGAAPDSAAAAKSPTGPGRVGPDKPHCNPIPPIKTTPSKSKLYERRNSLKNSLRISPLIPSSAAASAAACAAGFSPRSNNNNNNYYYNNAGGGGEILSPSILDFPALVLSPVTPLIPDPFNRSPTTTTTTTTTAAAVITAVNKAAEEKAIAEKGFFLHPSPATTPRDSEPRLLPLFPVTSPRLSGSDHPSS